MPSVLRQQIALKKGWKNRPWIKRATKSAWCRKPCVTMLFPKATAGKAVVIMQTVNVWGVPNLSMVIMEETK